MQKSKKIIWAVDPSSARSVIEENAASMLQVLQQSGETEIHPVYVATPGSANVPLEFFPLQMEMLLETVEKTFEEELRSFKIQGMKPLNVIVKPIATILGAVRELNAYASKIKADFIVVGTHARKGMPRLFLGSFAETLVLNATTPVLVVGPNMRPLNRIQNILFPTDLGVKAETDFKRVAAFAKMHGANITIFHSVRRPAILLPGSRAVISEATIIKEHETSARKRIEKLVELARGFEVNARAVVSVADLSVTDDVLRAAAEQDSDMIAMAPRSGWISAAIIGSAARQVVRASDRPVWLLHENALEASKPRKGKAA